jgi:predicted acyl esterase
VVYLTEGELRALHRKVCEPESLPYTMFSPCHSFTRKAATPVIPGKLMELDLGLWPISVLVKAHHRLRIAIARADRDTFVRIPAEGDLAFSVLHNGKHASFVDIPVANKRGQDVRYTLVH